jgi:hypothetical protein
VGLGVRNLRDDPEVLRETLICLIKTNQDRSRIAPEVIERLAAKTAGAA